MKTLKDVTNRTQYRSLPERGTSATIGAPGGTGKRVQTEKFGKKVIQHYCNQMSKRGLKGQVL